MRVILWLIPLEASRGVVVLSLLVVVVGGVANVLVFVGLDFVVAPGAFVGDNLIVDVRAGVVAAVVGIGVIIDAAPVGGEDIVVCACVVLTIVFVGEAGVIIVAVVVI